MNTILIPIQFWLAITLPVMAAFAPFIVYGNDIVLKWASLAVSPLIYVISSILILGLLSQLGRHGLIEGKFARTNEDVTYRIRRRYTSMWTFLFYFKPLYFLVLSIPSLKFLAFRLFGYKGNLNFVVYPDTWLRDLPVLSIGQNAYLSNKASVATNICLMDGRILVEGIGIGEKACVGHNTIVGPGTRIGDATEIDASVTSGLRVMYGDKVKVGELCGIQHGVKIEDEAVIEAVCVIGLRCRIGPGVKISEGSHIHTGTRIRDQKEADQYFSQETGAMSRARESVLVRLAGQLGLSDDKSKRAGIDEGQLEDKKLNRDIT